METVRFYWSFRSPYSWIAFHLAEPALEGLGVTLQHIPVFPPPDYRNDPTAIPAKVEYMAKHDLPRLAKRYGLHFTAPAGPDVEWIKPHAMWCYAASQGRAKEFGEAVFAARWSHGLDLGDPAVLADAARQARLDPEATVAAGDDEHWQTAVMEGMLGSVNDGVFGVPMFVYRGERFWGHDRLDFLVDAIRNGSTGTSAG
jgi:2-hydroxychromene-2-carboxylate isomerase